MICSVHMKFKYPAGDQEERKRWKAVLSKLNAKCRSYRRPEPCSRDKRAASTSSAISMGETSVSGSVSDVGSATKGADHEEAAVTCDLHQLEGD